MEELENKPADRSAGPHYRALITAGMPRCVDCHTHHAIQRAQAGMLAGDDIGHCGSCHDSESEAFAISQSIKNRLDRAAGELDRTAGSIAAVNRAGRDVQDLMALLGEARTHNLESIVLTHTLSEERVGGEIALLEERTDQIFETARQFHRELRRRTVNSILIFLLSLLMIVLVYFKRKQLIADYTENDIDA